MEGEQGGGWGDLPSGPLACIFATLACSKDLASCALVCKHFHHCLASAAAAWQAALVREHG